MRGVKRSPSRPGQPRHLAWAIMASALVTAGAQANEPAEWHGFIENNSHSQNRVGLTKFRNTAQLEGSKNLGSNGFFDNISLHGTFRATYDGVYDLNDDDFGKNAGSPILLENIGGPVSGAPSLLVPHGSGLVSNGTAFFGFNSTDPNAPNYNPNEGLLVLGSRLHEPGGGVTFGVPQRPCDEDRRGCISDYLDYDTSDLRFPEFNERADFIREAYVRADKMLDNGHNVAIKLGKQQIVWGRTDLFRVLDVLNPVDFSRNNIYDELEEIRIPMWMLEAEYQMGTTETFDDLNFSLVWNFDKFRPNNLGQGGTPYSILDAGSFFRGMKNCWDNGCTVSNFAFGELATDFPVGSIGIRGAELPDWNLSNTQIGVKVEGVFRDVGFSLNALSYRSQLPSLRGGGGGAFTVFNPFTGTQVVAPGIPAFDIVFPRLTLFGGSLDFYVDSLKSVFRLEGAYTRGEEFANTLRPDLYSESDVFRWVVGVDRSTWIRPLNESKAILFSAQLFGQHILDHELEQRALGPVGIPDWEDNYIATLLIKGWWMRDRLSPQIIFAHDFKADATVAEPGVEWIVNDNLKVTAKANIKFGTGARKFDDVRSINPFDPFTAVAPGQPAGESAGLGGFEPLGRFRAGPIGMAQEEDFVSINVRYSF